MGTGYSKEMDCVTFVIKNWHPNIETVTLGVLKVYLAETPESLGHHSLNRVNECLCVCVYCLAVLFQAGQPESLLIICDLKII